MVMKYYSCGYSLQGFEKSAKDPYETVFDELILDAANRYINAAKYMKKRFPDKEFDEITSIDVNNLENKFRKRTHDRLSEMKEIESFFMQDGYIFYNRNYTGPDVLNDIKNRLKSGKNEEKLG